MAPRSTFRSEEKVEVSLDSLKEAALDALYTFFTPARLLFRILAWPFRHVIRLIPSQNETPARKEGSLRPQG
jgi:hypothetical protein